MHTFPFFRLLVLFFPRYSVRDHHHPRPLPGPPPVSLPSLSRLSSYPTRPSESGPVSRSVSVPSDPPRPTPDPGRVTLPGLPGKTPVEAPRDVWSLGWWSVGTPVESYTREWRDVDSTQTSSLPLYLPPTEGCFPLTQSSLVPVQSQTPVTTPTSALGLTEPRSQPNP